jgi:predicted DNA-binding protein with PD1-like motif
MSQTIVGGRALISTSQKDNADGCELFISRVVDDCSMVRTLTTKAQRVLVSRLEPGEDLIDAITFVVKENGIKAAQFFGIGAISKARLGFFDMVTGEYLSYDIDKNLEVVSLTGNVALSENGSVVVHAHMVASDREGNCFGGHVMQGCEVSVTIELFLTELENNLTRAKDVLTGLNLLNLPE